MVTARLKSSPLPSDPQISWQPPMNSLAAHRKPLSDCPPPYSEQMNHLLTTAHSIIDQVSPLPANPLYSGSSPTHPQPPPPSLREILTAYRTKGDGDRDMLLAMLSAKTAEDQVGLFFLSLSLFFSHIS